LNCRKCGAELHPDQKVCIQCGTRTVAGGGFYVEEKEPWKPTRNMKYAAAGVVLLLIILLVARSLRTVPPDVVAKQWFDAMLSRQCATAAKYQSESFLSSMPAGMNDTLAISDDLVENIGTTNAQYTFGSPTLDTTNTAKVPITVKYTDGRTSQLEVDLTKSGRQWQISGFVK